jgi:DNA-binding MarR family transcriptional regulator
MSPFSNFARDTMQLNAKTTALVLVKPQSMGGTLAAMEEEGLVERQPHPTDGRQILYALSDEGREAKAKVSLAKREWLLAAIAQLYRAEQQTLLAAVDIIRRFGNP